MWEIQGEKFIFSETVTIDAPVEQVYKTVAAFDHYADFLSDVEKSQILDDGRCSMVVRAGPLRVDVVTSVDYYENERVDFEMLEGPPIDGASGSWILNPNDAGGTDITFEASFTSGKSGNWLLKTASKYVERKGLALIEAFKTQTMENMQA
jgi:ribosome-associated toxin RatA of RatAB toxin-antitoxin module